MIPQRRARVRRVRQADVSNRIKSAAPKGRGSSERSDPSNRIELYDSSEKSVEELGFQR
jgi:hypothetical protein